MTQQSAATELPSDSPTTTPPQNSTDIKQLLSLCPRDRAKHGANYAAKLPG
jgi:hypothetical protein